MPRMAKSEYDRLVKDQYICRIAFKGDLYPHIAPFLYVFDGRFMYFLSSNYGRKIQYFRDNPLVTVEIEHYSPDLSHFSFVSLPGRLVEVEEGEKKRQVRERFVGLIKTRMLSPNVLSAMGHSPEEPVEALLQGEKNSVWKLTEVRSWDSKATGADRKARRPHFFAAATESRSAWIKQLSATEKLANAEISGQQNRKIDGRI